MKEPQVSVIIPLWNAEDYISEAIESVLRSGSSVGEIVVVDNASTDKSVSRLNALGSDKVRLIRNIDNIGATRARHQAILMSKFEYISFLDADDFISPGAIKAGLSSIISTGADISNFSMKILPASGILQDFLPSVQGEITGIVGFERTVGEWSIHPMGVMRKSLYLKAINNFTFHGHSDDELLTRYIFMYAKKVVGNTGEYIYRRQHIKQSNKQQMIGRAKTTQEVIRLALSINLDSDQRLRMARNQLVRAIFGLSRRIKKSDELSIMVRDLVLGMKYIQIPWRLSDSFSLALYNSLTLYWKI